MRLREEEIFQKVARREITKSEAMIMIKELYNQGKETNSKDPLPEAGKQGGENGTIINNEDIIHNKIVEIVSNVLHIPDSEINLEVSFKDLGVDSISGVEIMRDINKEFNLNLDAVVLYDYSTIPGLVRHVFETSSKNNRILDVIKNSSAGTKKEMGASSFEAPQPALNTSKSVPGKISLKSKAEKTTNSIQGTKQIIASENVRISNSTSAKPAARISEDSIQTKVIDVICEVLHLPESEISFDLSFKELGVDSISGVEIIRDINKNFELNLDAVILYDYSTIPNFVKYVYKELEKSEKTFEKINQTTIEVQQSVQVVETKVAAAKVENVDYEESIQTKITEIVSSVLHIPEDELSFELSFKDLGVDSISGVEIIRDINKSFNLNLDAVILYDYSTIPNFAKYIYAEMEKSANIFGKVSQPKVEIVQVRQISQNEVPVKAKVDRTEYEEGIQNKITEIVSGVLHIPEDEISFETSFKDLGVDSISGVEIIRDINRIYNLNLDAVLLYDYSTIPGLSKYIVQESEKTRSTLLSISPAAKQEEPEKPLVKKEAGKIEFKLKSPEVKRDIPQPKPVETIQLENVAPKSKLNKLVLKQNKPSAQPASQVETIVETKPQPTPVKSEVVPENTYSNNFVTPEGDDRIEEIAIIGMSGRFPGANNLDEFWYNIENGVSSIIEVPKERWDIDEFYDPDPKAPNKTYSKWFGMVSDCDKFDPLFFNISPKEAELMDPQQRLFLEEAWKALEDAGYSDKDLSSCKCGVFVGAAFGDYDKKMSPDDFNNSGETFTGLSPSILSARISYHMNLIGPSIVVDTACSSSLIATHLACQSIMSNESDMAIAGGVRLMLTPDLQVQTSKVGMLSPTGTCKTFDQDADGIVMGEGCGAIILKPLSKALEDRDHIYGVIKGFGVNQDGKTNGITAPSAQSQTRLELEVYERFGINPENITLIEAHGTGTKLGDPIEVKALTEAFRHYTQKRQYCSIGSVKTNIGHATMAAGIASIIKVLLAIKHKRIPPLLNFKNTNEHINFNDSPFFVNTKAIDWNPENGITRIAAVSSFGMSGTNCHLIIEEPPER